MRGRAAVSIVAVIAMACGAPTPAPSPAVSNDVVSVQLTCQGLNAFFIYVGQVADSCSALVQRRVVSSVLPLDATWKVADPTVAGIGTHTFSGGTFATGVIGLAAGETVVTASVGGITGSLAVKVIAEDHLSLDAYVLQGDFRPGTTVTMQGVGVYAVASGDNGQLTLRIADQDGIVATSPSITALKGFDFFDLSATFTVPATSTQLCETVTLQIGSKVLSSGGDTACVKVLR